MLAIAALIAYPFAFAQPSAIVRPIERERPLLDGLEKLIPQPLRAEAKGDVTVHVDLPDEARALMRDLHRDRQGIAIGGCVLIALLGLATLKYFIDWRRK